jgi:S1-C subfamily serine protease
MLTKKSHARWRLHYSSRCCHGLRTSSRHQHCWRLAAINGHNKEKDEDFTSSSNHDTNDSSSSSSSTSTGTIRRRALFSGSALVATILVSQTTTPPSVARAYNDEEERRIGIFEKTSRSVVFIDTFVERRDSLTTNIMEVPLGSGSGFVWDKQGHIVTNYHVVRNSRSAQIAILLSGTDAKLAAAKSNSLTTTTTTTTAATALAVLSTNAENSADVSLRQTFTATIVGVDPGKDIAVLKIEADPVFLFPIAVGSSANIKVGQQAMAIGNPFGTFL